MTEALIHYRSGRYDGEPLGQVRLLCGLPLLDPGRDVPRLVVGRGDSGWVTCPECRARLDTHGTDRPGELSPAFEAQLTEEIRIRLDAVLERTDATGEELAAETVDAIRPLLISADANARAYSARRAEDDADGLPPGLQAALDDVAREAAASVSDAPPFDDWPPQQRAAFKQNYLPLVLTATRAQARVIRGEDD